jgi:hypothetical protein
MKATELLLAFLTSKVVLNIIFVLAILDIIGFITMNNFTAVIYFVLFALLMTLFSKNMIIVLGVPLVLVNTIVPSLQEGMENNGKDNDLKETIEKINDEKLKKNTDIVIPSLNVDKEEQTTEQPNDESFEVGRKKGGYNIDYASTVEGAYDDLNKILGSDGIKNLTDDTQRLMKQQMQLAESMKNMEPFIKNMGPMLEQAQGILGGLGNNKEGLGSIMEMAKKLTGSK